ncbi:MAG TPA: nucleotidyl transferase AbiEii/AbiGii toxin family protein [bacterium]|nr:nucleotidyl transferase AbiEii/AbiGii toxin family protein [bacterium]
MSKPEQSFTNFHEDPDFFREAVNFTAAETYFSPRLIEKDYFSTLLLQYLSIEDTLVFKGGTCLAKVHAGFYRLSEDLDFAISMSLNASRAERSKQAAGLKQHIAALPQQVPIFSIVQRLTGANNSMQYIGVIGYTSLLSRQRETINVELGLREPILMPVSRNPAQTLLLDPVSGKSLVVPVTVSSLSEIESFAEKYRAALCRREVAIRDFYDIDYAVRKQHIHPQDARFISLIQQKLSVPGNEPVDVSSNRLGILRQQLESQLKPVLRDSDYAEFDLVRAFEIVTEMAAKVT